MSVQLTFRNKFTKLNISGQCSTTVAGNYNFCIDLISIIEFFNFFFLERNCVFWDPSTNDWSGDNCELQEYTDDTTTCTCTHLTNFGVIMDINGNLADNVSTYVWQWSIAAWACGAKIAHFSYFFRHPSLNGLTVLRHSFMSLILTKWFFLFNCLDILTSSTLRRKRRFTAFEQPLWRSEPKNNIVTSLQFFPQESVKTITEASKCFAHR